MDTKEICPCPNLKCPIHGDCEKCNSRHVRKGFLSYCAFHTILPAIRQVIDETPESPVAKKLEALITPQLQAYEKLMDEHGLSQKNQDSLLKKVGEYSDY